MGGKGFLYTSLRKKNNLHQNYVLFFGPQTFYAKNYCIAVSFFLQKEMTLQSLWKQWIFLSDTKGQSGGFFDRFLTMCQMGQPQTMIHPSRLTFKIQMVVINLNQKKICQNSNNTNLFWWLWQFSLLWCHFFGKLCTIKTRIVFFHFFFWKFCEFAQKIYSNIQQTCNVWMLYWNW